MNNQLDKLNILVVTETKLDTVLFLQVDYLKLVSLLDLSTLNKTEYLSFTFFNILNQSITTQAQTYLKADLILIILNSPLKQQSTDICTFINKPFIHIRI